MKQISLLFFGLLVFNISSAQWPYENPNPATLSNAQKVEIDPAFSSDASGNTYICWTDYRNGKGEMYAQKLNKLGEPQWTKNGVLVGDVTQSEVFILTVRSIKPSPDGGAIVLWHQIPDSNNPSNRTLVVSRLDPTGKILEYSFEINSNLLNSDVTAATALIGFDGQGEPFYVFSLKSASVGIMLFNKKGITQLNKSRIEGSKVVIDDKNKRIIVLLKDLEPEFTAEIYDYDGNRIYLGINLFFNDPFPGTSRIDYISCSNGNVIIGRTLTGATNTVIAQKLNENLVNVWGKGGISFGSGTAFDIQVGENADGGATVAWIEPNSFQRRMTAARIDATGEKLWEKPVFDGQNNVNYLAPNKFASDGSNGMYNLWFTPKSIGFDLTIQHLNGDGNQLFGSQGKTVGDFTWYGAFRLIPHIEGGVISLYSGTKNTDINANDTYDLYTNYIDSKGVFGIQQALEASLVQTLYCPGQTVFPQLPEGTFEASLTKDGKTIKLTEATNKGSFLIPDPTENGAYELVFTNTNGQKTETFNITVANLVVPKITASKPEVCRSESVTLSSKCDAGEITWNTNVKANEITINPLSTGTYSVKCLIAGCPSSTGSDITIRVTEVSVTATAPALNYVGSNVSLSASGANTYSWTGPNGFAATGATAVILNAILTDNGNYIVTGANTIGCTGTASVSVLISPLLSSDLNKSNEILVYPNPSYDFLKIENLSKQDKVSVTNIKGQVIKLSLIDSKLDISKLPTGLYTLIIEKDAKVTSHKFIKN